MFISVVKQYHVPSARQSFWRSASDIPAVASGQGGGIPARPPPRVMEDIIGVSISGGTPKWMVCNGTYH